MRKAKSVRAGQGFTIVELLVVIAIIAILASLLLPGLARAKNKSRQIYCLNDLRVLTQASFVYATDHNDALPYNLGASEIADMLARGERYNWANSVLNWELSEGNTNVALNTEASLGSYVAKVGRIFRCPEDAALSPLQKEHGWTERSRSLSMNAMVGDAGEFTRSGQNINNPSYKQFKKFSHITAPDSIFVFIEEHPDSIGDGYYLNRYYSGEWIDLPASYHNGAANISFADGHLETHRWQSASTRKPAKSDVIHYPFALASDDRGDFNWLMERTSRR